MVNAEAMVALAAGAITKFQIGMVGIGAAANFAAAGIVLGLLLVIYAVDFTLEVNGGLSGGSFLNSNMGEKLLAAHNEIVKKSNYRQKVQSGVGGRDNADEEVNRVNNGQPLYLDWDNEKQEHFGVGEKGGQREEHGKIQIACVDVVAYSRDEIDNEAEENVAKHTGEKEKVKAGDAPIMLKGFSYNIIEIEKQQHKYSAGAGDEHKGEKSPNLTVENVGSGEGEEIDKCVGGVHHGEKPNRNIARHNIEHQIGQTESWVLIAKLGNLIAEPFHSIYLLKVELFIVVYNNIPALPKKVHE